MYRPLPAPSRNRLRQLLALALIACLSAIGPGGAPVLAMELPDNAMVLETSFDPAAPTTGDALTIQITITVDPTGTEDDESVAWSVALSEIGGLDVETATCGTTRNTSCLATTDVATNTIIFSGIVADPMADEALTEVEVRGTIASDAEQVAAVTCAGAIIVPAGATPATDATPDPGAPCRGTESSLELPVLPVVPTESPTEAPSPEPTATTEPTATPEPTSEPTATIEPTAEPTATPTPEPTTEPTASVEPTVEPTATPEPTATSTPEPTMTPTSEPTPTEAVTATATATAEPTAEPTTEPTAAAEPTGEPTTDPTSEPTATVEPTIEPTATTVVEPTPTEANDDDGGNIGLWIGVGALVVLAGAAGVVWNQRRNMS